ncbi:hypothetical protein BH10PSE3_BH10PSE3_01490 [soil metagenome]
MMAIHPSQVAPINETFTPSSDVVSAARAVVAAFETQPGVGAIAFEGKMLDAPHLAQAKRILSLANSWD